MNKAGLVESNNSARRHWSNVPVGSQRSESEPGTRAYFEDLERYRYGYETPFIPDFFDFAAMRELRVLEIGVGNGIDAVQMLRAGAYYTGVDVTPRHIELARRNCELHALGERANFHAGDLLDLRLDPAQFDRIYSFGVLHHIDHERDYLECCRTLLRPGGKLMLALYSKYSLFNAYLFATWVLRNRCATHFANWQSHLAELTPLDEPVTIKIRSKSELDALFRATGWQPVTYAKRGFVQRYLPFVGTRLRPDGAVLRAFARWLGWYHCYILRPR